MSPPSPSRSDRSPRHASVRRHTRGTRAPKPQRLSTRARRQQILEVALEQFAAGGFKGTTTRCIADAAGITEACIFQHFADKDTLYAAVLAHKSQEWPPEPWFTRLEALAATGDDEAVVRAVFTRILDRHERDPHCLRLMVFAALEDNALSQKLQGAQGPRLLRFLERYVADGQRAGRLRPGPPAVLARSVLAQPVLYALQRRLFRSVRSAAGRRAFIETGVALVLAGLRTADAVAPASGVA